MDSMKNVNFLVDKALFSLEIDGGIETGSDEVLLLYDENLLEFTPYNTKGFFISSFLNMKKFKEVKQGLTLLIKNELEQLGCRIDDNFSLENYHQFVDDEQHLSLARKAANGWDVETFPIPFAEVEKLMSNLLNRDVTAKMADGTYVFCVRLVRPNTISDSNPPHRDVWLDHLRNAINIYLPLCGSNELSALPLVEGSHLKSEKLLSRTASGAVVNGKKYTVPCVLAFDSKTLELSRPNPPSGSFLIFSPYLIHGGGYNLNESETRVSLEIRFWAKE